MHRVQWVAASFPDEGHGARAYLHAEAPVALVSANIGPTSAAKASYEGLLSDMDAHACAHDVVLTLQVRLSKSVESGCAMLAREVGSVVRLLGDADVIVETILGVDEIARLLLRTYEARSERDGGAGAAAGAWLTVEDPWPMAMAAATPAAFGSQRRTRTPKTRPTATVTIWPVRQPASVPPRSRGPKR